jgi:hypothetical protein
MRSPRLLGRNSLWCLCLWVAGCEAGEGLSSGVAGNKALAELSASELERICEATSRYRESAMPRELRAKAECVQRGLLTGNLKQCETVSMACQEAALATAERDGDAAVSEAGDAGASDAGLASGMQAQTFTCYSMGEVEDCRASVAELESCIQISLATAARSLHAMRCDTLEGEVGVGLESPTSTAICEALEQKCSGLSAVLNRFKSDAPPPDRPDGGVDGGLSSSCEALQLEYDGNRCGSSSQCPTLQCACGSLPRSFNLCNGVQGCVSAVDCAAACAAQTTALLLSCVQSLACEDDADCGDYRCVRGSTSASGQCARGEAGDRCLDADDCDSARCVGTPGAMTCAGDGENGSACSRAVECQSGICYQGFSSSGPGQCSAGDTDDPCSSSSQCVSGSCVYRYATGMYACSDRERGSLCASDADCLSGVCASGGRSQGLCSNGEHGDACDYASDCASQNCQTAPVTYEKSCGYAPFETCPQGVADCHGDCRPVQAACSGSSCEPICAGGSCSSLTLATWNPADKHESVTLSDADLSASSSDFDVAVRATIGVTGGKWYWEVTLTSASNYGYAAVGVTDMSASLEGGLGTYSAAGVGLAADGTLDTSAQGAIASCGYNAGDVVGVALDAEAREVFFSINGVWQGGADPQAGAGGIPIGISSAALFPVVSLYEADLLHADFGQQGEFAHAPPDGFEALHQE